MQKLLDDVQALHFPLMIACLLTAWRHGDCLSCDRRIAIWMRAREVKEISSTLRVASINLDLGVLANERSKGKTRRSVSILRCCA